MLRSESPTDRPENNQASTSFQVIQPTPVLPTPEAPTVTPAPEVISPALPPTRRAPPDSLPETAGYGALPYGLIFLVGVGYMGLGLYFWLDPQRRRK